MDKPTFDLEGAAELVGYEAALFGVAGFRCEQAQRAGDDGCAYLLCEAYLLHARNLVEFFFGSNRHGDTVTAGAYIEDWDDVEKGEPEARLRSHRDRLNKWVSHITLARLGDNEAWPTGQIFNDLAYVGALFLQRVPPGSRIDWAFHGLADMVEGAAPRPARETRFLPRQFGEQLGT